MRNMLSFWTTLAALPVEAFDCQDFQLFLLLSSALEVFTFFGGFLSPSSGLIWSFFAALARAGLMFASAEMTPGIGVLTVGVDGTETAGDPSALRF